MIDCPNLPDVVNLLASTLGRFLELNRQTNRRWSKLRVAQYITSSETIAGEISDTTLGRFLDPGHPTAPKAKTIQVVAAFLIEMRAITPRQIELAAQADPSRQPALLNDLFEVPRTEAFRGFLQDLAGQYTAIETRSPWLLIAELSLSHLAQTNVLVSGEILTLYSVGQFAALTHQLQDHDPKAGGLGPDALRTSGAMIATSHVSSGFALATTGLMALMQRPAGTGFASILNVARLAMNGRDQAAGLKGTRNLGWRPEAVDAVSIPIRFRDLHHPTDIVKAMSGEFSYTKNAIDPVRTMRPRRKPRASDQGMDFVSAAAGTLEAMMEAAARSGSGADHPGRAPDDRLRAALDADDLDGFIRALGDGGDPNLTLPGDETPIIFRLARDGQTAWVEALLATGRCDLTRTDRHGFTASHGPGVVARRFAPGSLTGMTPARFAALAQRLQAEEMRQLRKLGLEQPKGP